MLNVMGSPQAVTRSPWPSKTFVREKLRRYPGKRHGDDDRYLPPWAPRLHSYSQTAIFHPAAQSICLHLETAVDFLQVARTSEE